MIDDISSKLPTLSSARAVGQRGASQSGAKVAATRSKRLFSEMSRDARGREARARSNSEHLDAAVEWLYAAQDATDVGGCASAYNLVLGWGEAYPETTGYIVPTLYDYADRVESREARTRAAEMAEWLLEIQLSDGGFPEGTDPKPDSEPSIFNTGQILFGLVRSYRETGDDRFREAARRAGEWLVSVQHEDGYWDQYDYHGVVHSYSSRVGWSLLEAYEIVGAEELRDAGRRNLEWVASLQRPNGWFEHCGFKPDEDPFLHTLAYTIRGLLEGGLLLEDEEFVEAARHSADTLLGLQNRDGPLDGRYDENFDGSPFYCLTGNAQMAIVWYRLAQVTGEKSYRRAADEAVAFLKRHQRMSGAPELKGGLKGSHPIWGSYMFFRFPNWAAKFLADALLLSSEFSDE